MLVTCNANVMGKGHFPREEPAPAAAPPAARQPSPYRPTPTGSAAGCLCSQVAMCNGSGRQRCFTLLTMRAQWAEAVQLQHIKHKAYDSNHVIYTFWKLSLFLFIFIKYFNNFYKFYVHLLQYRYMCLYIFMFSLSNCNDLFVFLDSFTCCKAAFRF